MSSSPTQTATDNVREALESARERLEPAIDRAIDRALDTARDVESRVAPHVAGALQTAADRISPDDDSTRVGAAAAAAAAQLERASARLEPHRARWPWFVAGALAATGVAYLVVRRVRRPSGVSDAPYATGHFSSERPSDTPVDAAEAKVSASIAEAKDAVAGAVDAAADSTS